MAGRLDVAAATLDEGRLRSAEGVNREEGAIILWQDVDPPTRLRGLRANKSPLQGPSPLGLSCQGSSLFTLVRTSASALAQIYQHFLFLSMTELINAN